MKFMGYGAYDKITKAQREMLINFIIKSPRLKKRDFHKFAVSLGLLPDDAEEVLFEYIKHQKNPDLPLPPPSCPVCGTRHPHFIHTSGHGIRGAGRAELGQPHTTYTMHMSPKEMEGMIYGPMFEEILRKRGTSCPAGKWEHPPATSGYFFRGIGSLGNEGKKVLPLWGLIGAIALLGLLFSSSP